MNSSRWPKITLIILFLCVFLSFAAYIAYRSERNTNSAMFSQPVYPQEVLEPIVTEEASSTDYNLEIEYPKSSTKLLPDIFSFVQNQKEQFLSDIEDATGSPQIDFLGPSAVVPWSFDITTSIATSSKTTSYILEVDDFEGGAHGDTTDYTFNYDNSTGKPITLSDVLQNSSSTYETLSTLAQKYFTGKFSDEALSNLAQGAGPDPVNFSSWYLQGDNMVFIFEPYSIGPYALGIQEFSIPKNQIASLLTGKY